MAHLSVLMHEVIEGLAIKPADVIVDGTINGGVAQNLDEFAPLFTVDSSTTYRFMNGLLF